MDDIVKAALRKWPHVPHCYGWLALDARGQWYMRDERTQRAGPFPQVKGSRIEHDKLRAFIERNYAGDERGAWFFQNGPQRVYVQLEAAPFVWRLSLPDAPPSGAAPIAIHAHTGQAAAAAAPLACWCDESGRLFAETDLGFGLVHTLDIELAADAVERGAWPSPRTLAFAAMPARFGYRLDPQPPAPLP